MNPIKPTIMIYAKQANSNLLKEILCGIEEEELFYTLQVVHGPENKEALAKMAALSSLLGVGVGIVEETACLVTKSTLEYPPIYTATGSANEGRRLGKNAARFVKMKSFI